MRFEGTLYIISRYLFFCTSTIPFSFLLRIPSFIPFLRCNRRTSLLIYLNPKKNSSININTTQKSDLNFHRFIRSKAFLSRNFNLDGKKTPKRIDKKKKKKKKKKNKLKRHTIQRGRIIVTKLNYRSTLPVIPLFLKYRPSSPSSRPTLTRHGCLSLKKREATFPSAFN